MERLIEKLERDITPLVSTVERDEFIIASEKAFDCAFNGNVPLSYQNALK